MVRKLALVIGSLLMVALSIALLHGHSARSMQNAPMPLATGKTITPVGDQTSVGSFPVNFAVSPDGRFLAVTDSGFRQYLSILDMADGRVVSKIPVGKSRGNDREDKQGLYYGLAFGARRGENFHLFVSRGGEEAAALYELSPTGSLRETATRLESRFVGVNKDLRNVVAGIALNSDGTRLYAADNNTSPDTGMKGSLTILDTSSGRQIERIPVGGFPFGVAAITTGRDKDRKVYVSSERDGLVSIVDPVAMRHVRDVRVGANPTSLLLDRDQRRLFVSNSSGDTISVIDTQTDRVVKTILLRPQEVRGLAGATPLGMALSASGDRLFVALADMNAVAVVDTAKGDVTGYIPAGWYPTACAVSPDGKRLFIANAKGLAARNPNAKPGPNGQYIQDLLEGTVAMVRVPTDLELKQMTEAVLNNNKVAEARRADFLNPGIEHVIYIIKENRTYDQVLGDLKQGNGDPSLTLFPREVTPNQHALAERFVLLDNFYCCAEVSADGWNWSTSAMANEYVSRNAPYNYSGRGRVYDYEGQNNGVPVDLLGLPDVAKSPGGYLWDNAIGRGVSLRNYGFFTNFVDPETRSKTGPPAPVQENQPNKKALVGKTDTSYRLYDLDYPDSDAWTLHGFDFPKRMKSFGAFHSTSRFQEWKREYDGFVGKGNMPKLMLVRFGNNHTRGTTPGTPSPRAFVADNDYAVGQLVEHVSKGPYWKKTAIFIVEDDAQNGHDHVDAHRSTAFVISPYVKRSTVDSQFHNTATTLRTMELILGLPPLCQYDAIARPFSFFAAEPANDAPYEAILPARNIVTQINAKTAYGAKESAKLAFDKADAVPDEVLTRILWHAIKGAQSPEPSRRSGAISSRPRDDD